ncbi:uncharacterized protein PHACADRAFT_201688 [Phanerochaete carnosa HHB-10118-sp]|uniref:Uncharacterized protein n=1 Tax=Phanerochaete carnosa (strain HHB-10118-sp) TaxID=650164 RepID=K5VE71_PHACS|nr:uncharacterized protein PHACADRAFT_201688 [Phanerochaete carnosa HHB-10118-sp]EKM49428.1 hypothetical protein PHACADRAFT_201688 [Phanerochaete carnosa HHB-10118-sp]
MAENSWEPEGNLKNAAEILKRYKEVKGITLTTQQPTPKLTTTTWPLTHSTIAMAVPRLLSEKPHLPHPRLPSLPFKRKLWLTATALSLGSPPTMYKENAELIQIPLGFEFGICVHITARNINPLDDGSDPNDSPTHLAYLRDIVNNPQRCRGWVNKIDNIAHDQTALQALLDATDDMTSGALFAGIVEKGQEVQAGFDKVARDGQAIREAVEAIQRNAVNFSRFLNHGDGSSSTNVKLSAPTPLCLTEGSAEMATECAKELTVTSMYSLCSICSRSTLLATSLAPSIIINNTIDSSLAAAPTACLSFSNSMLRVLEDSLPTSDAILAISMHAGSSSLLSESLSVPSRGVLHAKSSGGGVDARSSATRVPDKRSNGDRFRTEESYVPSVSAPHKVATEELCELTWLWLVQFLALQLIVLRFFLW